MSCSLLGGYCLACVPPHDATSRVTGISDQDWSGADASLTGWSGYRIHAHRHSFWPTPRRRGWKGKLGGCQMLKEDIVMMVNSLCKSNRKQWYQRADEKSAMVSSIMREVGQRLETREISHLISIYKYLFTNRSPPITCTILEGL